MRLTPSLKRLALAILAVWGIVFSAAPAYAQTTVTAVAAGGYYSLFLKSDGSVWAMGKNNGSQLGDGSTTNQSTPEQILSNGVAAIAASPGLIAGSGHSLFLKTDGSLWAVGDNGSGELGDGTTTNQSTPEQIVSGGVVAIAAGQSFSLFLENDGSLWVMGANENNQLGDGTTTYRHTPEKIVSSGVIAIAAGTSHSLFLKSDGSLWSMGDNSDGQLGNGTTSNASTPEQIVSSGVIAIAAGSSHSLFLKSDGSLWGMGLNSYGQLGNGTTTNTNTPEQIVASGVIGIAAGGDDSMVLETGGSLWTMGRNDRGEVGNGTTINQKTPVQIVASGVTAISEGTANALFIKSDGSLWAMGDNTYGEFGNGTTINGHVPVQVMTVFANPAVWQQTAYQTGIVGENAVFLVVATGSPAPTVQWQRLPAGSSTWGPLSDGSIYSGTASSTLTVNNLTQAMSGDQFRCVATNTQGVATSNDVALAVLPDGGATAISAGGDFSLFIKSDGSLWAMGDNSSGQLGDGSTTNHSVPEEILASGVVAVAAGYDFSLFLKNDGSLWGMGDNGYGHLGDGATSAAVIANPEQIVASGVVAIAAGNDHSLFVKNDGSLWAMGQDDRDQLGVAPIGPAATYYPTPVQVVANGVSAIAAGYSFSLFIENDGSLWAMGDDEDGRIGNGVESPNTLEQIESSGVVAVAAGVYDSFFLKSDGSLWGMGNNDYGQLGDGTSQYNRTTPEQIAASGVVAITTGQYHSLFLKSNGSLWAMGYNAMGQLGDGTTTTQINPEQVVSSGVVAVSVNYNHSMFIKSDGSLWAMGDNAEGELGNGMTHDSSIPLEIINGVIVPITTQPDSQTVTAGSAAIFTAAASSTPAPTYQWQVSTDGGTTWNNTVDGSTYSGSITGSLTISNTTPASSGYQYRLIATDGANISTSNAAILTVDASQPPVAPTLNPPVATSPNSVTLTWTTTGSFDTLTLQRSANGINWTTIATLNPSTLQYVDTGLSPLTTYHYQIDATYEGVSSVFSAASTVSTLQAGNTTAMPIAAGGAYSLFLKSDGSLWGMGYNRYGQLGDGTSGFTDFDPTPKQIVASGVTAISAGGHSLFLKSDGSLWGMGYDGTGELGDGTENEAGQLTPEQIVASGVIAISAGGGHSLFLKSDGSLWGMGENELGQLGDGTSTNRLTPEEIVSGGVTAIAAGSDFSLFLKNDGSLWAMGDDLYGTLGDGKTTASGQFTPEQIETSGVTAISAGEYNSLFLKSDGSLWVMGDNDFGQLGDNTTTSHSTPEQIEAGGVTAISVGDGFNLFLKSDGSLWVMGENNYGQLGDGSTTNHLIPEQIEASGVTVIAGGYQNSLFRKSDGSLWAMGNNYYGELGDGTTNDSHVPEEIVDGVPAIATQPADQTITAGSEATFTAAASGTPTPTDQWQVSTDSGTTWTDLTDGSGITGSTTGTFTINDTSTAMSGNQYRMVAISGANTTASNAATLTVNAPPPTPVMSAGTITPTSVVLNWNDLSLATALTLQERVTGTSNWSTVSSTLASTLTTYTATGLSPSTSYDFQLEADIGPWSNTVTVTTLAPPPPAVPTLNAPVALGTNSVLLTWSTTGSFDTLTLQRSTDGINWTTIDTINPGSSQYIDRGLSQFTTYYYRIDATQNGVSSAFSSSSTVQTQAVPPAVPTLNTPVATGPATVTLSWSTTGTFDTLTLQRSLDGANWSTIATINPGTTHYTDTGLSPLTTYYYQIDATQNGASSNFSAAGTVETPAAPAVPTLNPPVASSSTSVTLTWSTTGSFDTVTLQRSTDGIHWTTIATINPGTTQYNDTGLSQLTSYYYQIDATLGGISSAYSSAGTISTPPLPVISVQPQNQSGAVGVGFTFSITAVGTGLGYQWQVSTDHGATWIALANNGVYSGVTTATLTLADTTADLSGFEYECVASNNNGAATSNPATLTLVESGAYYVATTTTVTAISATGVVSTFATGFSDLQAIAIDGSGNVYVAENSNGNIYKITPGGVVSTFASGFSSPHGLAFDANSNLYVANFGNGTISKITPAGVVSPFATGLSSPVGLAFDANQNLFVGCYSGSTVQKITPAGVVSQFAGGFSGSEGLAFDGNGNLFVANFTSTTVSKVTPAGVVSTFANGFGNPDGLAVDKNGNLLVSNGLGNDVVMVTPAGVESTLASSLMRPTGIVLAPPTVPVGSGGPVVPPAVPTLNTPVASSDTSVTLTWSITGTFDTLTLQRSPDGTNWTTIATIDPGTTQYLDTGLSPLTSYDYRIQATQYGFSSAFSSASSVETAAPAPPSVPTLDAPVVSVPNSVTLTWSAAGTYDTVEIERSLDETNWTTIATVPFGTTQYVDASLLPDTTYFYRIKATQYGLDSAFTPAQSVKTDPLQELINRWSFNLSAGGAPDGTVVTDSVSGAQAVVRGTGATFDGSNIILPGHTNGQGPNSTTAAYVDLPNGLLSSKKSVTLEIWAAPLDNDTTNAQVLFDFGQSTYTGAPDGEWTGASTTGMGSGVHEQNNEFSLWIGESGPGLSQNVMGTLINGDDVSQYVNVTTTVGTQYHYVMTYDSGVGSTTGGTVTLYRNGVKLTSAVNNQPLSSMVDVNDWLGRSQYTDILLVNVSIQEFRLYNFAFSQADVTASYAGGPTGTPIAPNNTNFAPTPVLTAGATNSNSVDLTWNDLSAATELTLQYRITGTPTWTTVAELDSTLTSYTATGLSPSTSYDFQLQADNGPWSNTVTVATTVAPPPGPTLATPIVSSPTSVTLNWTIAGAFDTLEIERSLDGVNWTTIATIDPGTTQYVDTGLLPFTSYSYRMRSTLNGVDSNYTPVAIVTTVNAPPPPSTHSLINRWSFNVTAGAAPDGTVMTDSVSGAQAVVRGIGGTFDGANLVLPGHTNGQGPNSTTAAYVDLPNGLLSSKISLSLEIWAAPLDNETANSQTLFDFGQSNYAGTPDGEWTGASTTGMGPGINERTNEFSFWIAQGGLNENTMGVLINGADVSQNFNVTTTVGTQYHYVMTYASGVGSSTGGTVTLYRNGVKETSAVVNQPLSSMIDVNNWLGRSQYSDVLLANVAIQEFRIYDFALDSADVAASEAAGPDAPTPPAAGGHLPLPAPVLAATASTDNSITLSWNDLSAASALTLQERVSGTTAWTTVSSTLASSLTSYTATGLSPTTNYDFQLEADNGPWSNTVTAMTEAPPQAVLAAGTITYNSVNLTWNNLAAAAALTLQYRVTGASGWTTVSSSLASTLTNYTVSGLSPTTSYDFQLEANGGAWSNTVTATTSAQPPPIPVLNTPVSYAIGTTEIILTWNISGQYDTVVVQRSTNPVIGFVTIATLPSGATQYIDTGLAPNTSYYYRIYTIYKGANSPFTAAKLIRTAITPPPQPTAPGFIIAAPISDTAISIFWQGANGVVIYQIQRLNGGVWTTIGTTPASASYFTDTTGLPQTFYDYRIESVNAAGVSSPISAISETYAQLDAWRLANFGTTAITTASASVATDFDGVPNLTKFAFNLNVGEQAPTLVAGTGTFGLPATWWDPATGSLFVEFVCRNSALNPGITYTVQFSSDLVNWTDSGTLVQSTAIDTIWQRVRYQDTTPVAAGASHARFARVMVTQTTGN